MLAEVLYYAGQLSISGPLGLTGHLGLRIGTQRLWMTQRGVRRGNFRRWLKHTLHRGEGPVYGVPFTLNRQQAMSLAAYFSRLQTERPGYFHIRRNCSQTVCRALRAAQLPTPLNPLCTLLPQWAFRWFIRRYQPAELLIHEVNNPIHSHPEDGKPSSYGS